MKLPIKYFFLSLVACIIIYCISIGCFGKKSIDFNAKNLINIDYEDPATRNLISKKLSHKTMLFKDNSPYASDDKKYPKKLEYDLYRPADISDNLPLIIFFHSGAFIVGDKENFIASQYANDLASAGYAVASVDYRQIRLPGWISNEKLDDDEVYSNTLFDLNIPVKRMLYDAHLDAHAAIRYFKNSHNSLGIDPDNIFVAGFSAGGILAMNLLFMNDSEAKEFFGRAYTNCISCLPSINDSEDKSLEFVKGYISIGGAVLDPSHIKNDLESDKPLLMFHGSKDQIVDTHKNKPFQKYNKDYDIELTTPEFFADLGVLSRDQANSQGRFTIGGINIGLTMPKYIITFLINVFTPDLYGSRIVYGQRMDKTTLVNMTDGSHNFMESHSGELSGPYYKSIDIITDFINFYK